MDVAAILRNKVDISQVIQLTQALNAPNTPNNRGNVAYQTPDLSQEYGTDINIYNWGSAAIHHHLQQTLGSLNWLRHCTEKQYNGAARHST